ncbi:hypothetical protein ACJVC5_16370 [Peredibacter sp. HCB2-198]|uniref:hypothetical protein n=1 Tax=Peredibacter sp. HCB2-198 TaxID=3383025 RepID=UPI0038B5A36F
MKDSISVGRILLAVFIGGVVYPGLALIVNSINCSCGIQKFVSSGVLPLILVGIGSFFSVKDLKKWEMNFLVALSVILVIYASFRVFLTGSLEQLFEESFIKFCVASGIFGSVGAMIKVVSLKSKLPEFQISKTQSYEQALNYRMHPVMRFLSGLMGSVFVSTPVLILFASHKDKEISEFPDGMIVFLIFMMVCCVGMGLLFLAYAIPGKTPELILRYLKKQAEIKDN